MFADAEIAAATRSSRRDAGRASRRAKALDDVPELEVVLAAGDVSVEHVDVVARAMKRLQPAQRGVLASRGERHAEIAAGSSPEEFEAYLNVEVARLDEREGVNGWPVRNGRCGCGPGPIGTRGW